MIKVVATTLGVDVDPESFDHRAVWNASEEWIEMHLVAREPVRFELADRVVEVAEGEHILTEISAKFTMERLADDLDAAGLDLVAHWDDGDFVVSLSRVATSG